MIESKVLLICKKNDLNEPDLIREVALLVVCRMFLID
jgi:hypothetical protein